MMWSKYEKDKGGQGHLMDLDLNLDFDFKDILRFCHISVLVTFHFGDISVLVTFQFW